MRNDILNERGTIDPVRYKPVARLGDISYATLGNAFRIPRPRWAAEKDFISQLLRSDSNKAELAEGRS